MLQPPAPKKGVSGLLTQKQTLSGGGAPEVGDLHLVEDGSERSGALVSNVVVSETASDGNGEKVSVSMGVDTEASTGSWFERWVAYSSTCSVKLPLRPSTRAAAPLGPRLFHGRLRARVNGGGC